jgi:hypothetical protein
MSLQVAREPLARLEKASAYLEMLWQSRLVPYDLVASMREVIVSLGLHRFTPNVHLHYAHSPERMLRLMFLGIARCAIVTGRRGVLPKVQSLARKMQLSLPPTERSTDPRQLRLNF